MIQRIRIACYVSQLVCVCGFGSLLYAQDTIPIQEFPTADQVHLDRYREAALEKWTGEVTALEAKDKTETHPADSILFVGSSSIRLWEDISTDMVPYHAIQRGYGGAKWSDVAVFIDRLIAPHECRAIVYFVGNDIVGSDEDRTPAEVADLFGYVLGRVRKHHGDVPVFYVGITPCNSRFAAWPTAKAGNEAVRQLCERSPHTHFIGTESIFLDAAGKPRGEFFVQDQLHLNRDGYLRWSSAIKSQLDSVLGGAK